jgi:hypothetical protein
LDQADLGWDQAIAEFNRSRYNLKANFYQPGLALVPGARKTE